MKRALVAVLSTVGVVATLVLAAPAGAAPTTITFDEQAATTDLTGLYPGISITGAYGTVFALPGADSGNWGIEGTDGPQFLGSNSGGAITISFTTPVFSFSIDCSRSNGSSEDDSVTVAGVPAGGASTTASATFGAINTWSTLSISGGPFTSVTITPSGSGFNPFGCDRMITDTQESTTTTTAPPTTTVPSTNPAAVEAVTVAPAFTG